MTQLATSGLRAGILSASIALLVGSCGGGGGGGGGSAATGTLNLALTDAPVDAADEVVVEFTGVEIKASGGEIVDITYDTPRQIDLLALTGGVSEVIVDGQVLPAGQVEWIRLKVNATQGGDPMDDSYIVIGGVIHELTIPSGAQTGLKLNRPITIPENGIASFTIDFDLRKSVHEAAGDYVLRPTLRLVDNSTDGALSGTVDLAAALCADPAAVYVFEGAGVTPDDVDGVDPDPVATASVDPVTGDYTVAFLPAGEYTAAFTCDAADDAPDTDDDAAVAFSGTTDVSITAGQTTLLDF